MKPIKPNSDSQPELLLELEALPSAQRSPARSQRKGAMAAALAPRPSFQSRRAFREELSNFAEFGSPSLKMDTQAETSSGQAVTVPTFVNEFWTSAQRAASSLHELSYRACFKPQLPRFFIERLTRPGDRVYDPFMGRGTTPIEAALLGRVPVGCDVNPLSLRLVRPRVSPPTLEHIEARLGQIDLSRSGEVWEDLLAFYHPQTLREITALKEYLLRRIEEGSFDAVDDWIGMVALNRLTGHSPGFFSVYTLPPNLATSVRRQIKINEQRGQVPPVRDVRKILLKKSRQLLGDCAASVRSTLSSVAPGAQWVTSLCSSTPAIASESVRLVVTSPPFLNIVQYAEDNWLRCWFMGVDAKKVEITMATKVKTWQEAMRPVFQELARVLEPGGVVAFEVGEVGKGEIKLEQAVIPCGLDAGLRADLVMINAQEFTKTANCWGVDNNSKGTNSNRIVVFSKT